MRNDDFVQLVYSHPVLEVKKRAKAFIRPEVYRYLLAIGRLDQSRASVLYVPSDEPKRQVDPPSLVSAILCFILSVSLPLRRNPSPPGTTVSS